MNVEQLYEEITHLTPADRQRLVARVVRDESEGATTRPDPSSIIGMMADEPDVMDEACKLVMTAREKSRMRPADG